MDCSWEDCNYRIEALNIILNRLKFLEENLYEIKQLLEYPLKHLQASQKIYDFLLEFYDSLDQQLPMGPGTDINLLDARMNEMRKNEFTAMKRGIDAMKTSLDKREKDVTKDIIAKLDDYLHRIKYLCVEVSIHSNNYASVIIILEILINRPSLYLNLTCYLSCTLFCLKRQLSEMFAPLLNILKMPPIPHIITRISVKVNPKI